MAFPRYISKSAFESGTGALTVGALTGTQAGDIVILFVESANETIATPTGYKVLATQVGTGTAGAAGAVRIASFYRILEDVADTATSVADSGNHTTAIKMLFRDTSLADGAFFVTATSVQATASTAMTFPAVVAATDESLIVLAVALDTDAASTTTVGNVTNASLANITERHDQTVIAGQGGGLAVITGQEATAGTTGTSTATGSTSVTRAYHTISLSRVAPQTTTTTFNQLSAANYAALSDAMRITVGATGSVRVTASGTFQPNTLTNGTYGIETKWYYRQYGTDAWTTTAVKPDTIDALVSTGVLDTIGEFVNDETITGLTNGVEYEFVLFGDRVSATPTNNISFSATASIALSNNGILNATEAGQDTASGTGNVIVTGALSASESGDDTFAGDGFLTANAITGSMSAAETGDDAFSGSGLVVTNSVTGSMAATEVGADTLAASGQVAYGNTDTDTTYNTITNNVFAAITDVLYVRTGIGGNLFFSGEFNFEPIDLINGSYDVKAIWRYRTVGGAWTDVGGEIFSVSAANIVGGAISNVGEITVAASLLGLSANTNYEVQLYARRLLNTPANTIQFTASTVNATVSSISPTTFGVMAATETGDDVAAFSGKVLISGAMSVSETGQDTAAITGFVGISGQLAATESGNDVASITGNVRISGQAAMVESGVDGFSASGYLLSPSITGSMSAIEVGEDTFNATGIAGTSSNLLKVGTSSVVNLYLGSIPVSKAYLGTTRVF